MYRARKVFTGFDPKVDTGRAQEAIKKVLEVAAGQGGVTRDIAINVAARFAKVSVGAVRSQADIAVNWTDRASPAITGDSTLSSLEAGILRLIVSHDNIVQYVLEKIDPAHLSSRMVSLWRYLARLEEEGEDVGIARKIMELIDDVDLRSMLSVAKIEVDSRKSEEEVSPVIELSIIAGKLESKAARLAICGS